MPTLILGLIAGTYLNNAQFRAMTDKAAKDLAGKAFDFVSAKGAGVNAKPTTETPPTAD